MPVVEYKVLSVRDSQSAAGTKLVALEGDTDCELQAGDVLRFTQVSESPLKPRAQQILQMLATGKTYSRIAFELGVEVSTIRTHIHYMYRELDVPDRAQAVLVAWREGWID